MDSKVTQLLMQWEKPFIRDQDLNILFQEKPSKRYDTVKYALSKGFLIHLRRGLYLIGPPYGKGQCDPFEVAQVIYGPSYISFESALSYHGWIPEAVYHTTCACVKRAKIFETPIGGFRYFHTPNDHFFLNVTIVEEKSSFIMAEPWKAIADMIYSSKKQWQSLEDLTLDLRVEPETLLQSDRESLFHIASCYASHRVRTILSQFYKELLNGYSDH